MTEANPEKRTVGGLRVLSAYWQASLFVGLVTVALGIVVTLHPSTSTNVVAVLLGVLILAAGVFQLIRALDQEHSGRTWSAVAGLGFVVIGVVLIRHLDVTRSLIALLIAVVWIIQGVAELFSAADSARPGRAFAALYGLVSLAAGIVVLVVPTGSLNALATLLGIWFIVIGVVQVIGAFYLRHAIAHPTA